MISNITVIIAAALLILNISPVVSQQNECSCTPLEYTWILNLTNPCDVSDIAIGPNTGITGIFCDVDVDTIDGDTNNNEVSVDGVPVVISSFLLVELIGGNLETNKTDTRLTDGDTIKFVSKARAVPGYISTSFLAEIVGRNAANEKVQLSIFIQLSNICERPPFKDGNSIGWLIYVSHLISHTMLL